MIAYTGDDIHLMSRLNRVKTLNGKSRLHHYYAQNGVRRLTPAQKRRDRKKVNKFMKNWR
ncbi:hypothetical protein GCM10018783_74040 [Streptomyces griseosporeus]|nr:hypothetical protein GCM10018783_74040 [Streptomyces griseosporeus]